MATKLKIKRSTVSGVVPTTVDIDTAELAVNLADKKLFTSNGTAVLELGSNLTNLSVTGNATLAGVIANGSLGTSGHVLHSNGTSTYWAADDQGVTSVATGDGLTGGPITATGTVSVLANNGITANATGLFVGQGTGTVVNATGVHVNASYIATIAANSATGSLTNVFTVGTAAYFVANGNLGIGTNTPNYRLHVYNSNTTAKDMAVFGSAGGDSTVYHQTTNGTAIFAVDSFGPTSAARFPFITVRSFNSNATGGDTGGYPVLKFERYAGNNSLGAATPASQIISSIQSFGSNTTSALTATAIGSIAEATFTTGAQAALRFQTANTSGLFERMRITSNGDVGIGNSTPTHKLRVEGSISLSEAFVANNSNGISGQVLTSNGTGVYWSTLAGVNTAAQYSWTNTHTFNANITISDTSDIVMQPGAGLSANGSLGTTGQVLSSNGTSVYWATPSGGGATLTANNTDTQTFYIPMANTTSGTWSNAVVSTTKMYFVPSSGTLSATEFVSLSDISKKTNVKQIEDASAVVDMIRGVEFVWKDTGSHSAGVIAQELEQVLPDLVLTDKAGIKSVNYAGIIGYLIEAIKEQGERIRQLESR